MPKGLFQTTLSSSCRCASNLDEFFNITSAFGTTLSSLLTVKLHAEQVAHDMVVWITDYLYNRRQHVRWKWTVSDVVTENTGAPQGPMLSPLLFAIYTSQRKSTEFISFKFNLIKTMTN